MIKKEIAHLNSEVLKEASEKILRDFGLDFSGEKFKDLNGAVIKSAKESGNKSPLLFSELLIKNSLDEDELDILLKNLTVGETYFFRDEKLFSALQSRQIKELFKNKNLVNVWSAGCASGEEPYSLAILFDKFFNEKTSTQFKIYAGDINKHSIEKAKKGFYRDWSFRSTPDWVKKDYFYERKKGLFEISDTIKSKVEFSLTNLSETEKIKNEPAKFDIIICRNVLIYFSKPLVKNLLEAFYHKLNSDGLYITTASESINISKNLFSKFIDDNNTIFIKNNKNPILSFDKTFFKKEIIKKKLPAAKVPPVKETIILKKGINKTDFNKIYQEAVLEYEKGNYAKAMKLFELVESEIKTTKEKFNDTAELHFYLIKNYMKLGDTKKANQLCGISLKKEKLDYRLHYLHGILLQENGEFEKAEEAFNKSVYLNNKFPLSFFALANLQISMGKNIYKKNFQKSVKLLTDFEVDKIVKYSDGSSAGDLLKQITSLTD